MNTIIHPSYFPSISQFAAIAQSSNLILETGDNFQKQTNRNRMYIYSPNGVQLLNIPVKHSTQSRQKTKDIQLETAFDWQKQHFKSLEAAYRSSPFFEFFEDALMPIFEKKHVYLMDLNLQTMEIVSKCLGIKLNYEISSEFEQNFDGSDFRKLIDGKKDTTIINPYTQVFEEKHGFLNNLSVLDLLFNEGRFALDYLKKQQL